MEKKICKLRRALQIYQNLANFGPKTADISWLIITPCYRYLATTNH